MKKLFLLILILFIFGSVYYFRNDTSVSPLSSATDLTPTDTPAQSLAPEKTSLFVPYWSLSSTAPFTAYDPIIYFGIIPDAAGVNTDENGYRSLETFARKAEGKTTYLTLRMLDAKTNFAILENTALQERLIDETLAAAGKYGFDGIVLDLEVSALPFESVIQQIAAFNKRFYSETKKEKLHYAVTLYGDTFFRIRPFNVKDIAAHSDEIMIMAYDFHKSRGNPGPNFPLGGKEKFGYDYPSLIDHFSAAVPQRKLTVIFGLFGYDWAVNKEKNMTTHGVPLSFNQIEARFITECRFSSCKRTRDPLSAESFISYTNTDGETHLVWFEDMESVKKKQAFLRSRGINSFSFWAHSYF